LATETGTYYLQYFSNSLAHNVYLFEHC